jgi:hypothetical protein
VAARFGRGMAAGPTMNPRKTPGLSRCPLANPTTPMARSLISCAGAPADYAERCLGHVIGGGGISMTSTSSAGASATHSRPSRRDAEGRLQRSCSGGWKPAGSSRELVLLDVARIGAFAICPVIHLPAAIPPTQHRVPLALSQQDTSSGSSCSRRSPDRALWHPLAVAPTRGSPIRRTMCR